MCGLHTLRPTTKRVPYGHATNSMVRPESGSPSAFSDAPERASSSLTRSGLQLGQESIISVAGPMARSLASCTYFMRAVQNANPADYDATSLPFAFDEAALARFGTEGKLSFGVMRTDHLVNPTPPIRRALETVIEKVRLAGHEVIEFDVSEFSGYRDLANAFYAADGGEDIQRVLSAIEEPLIEGVIMEEGHRIPSVFALWQLNRAKEAMQQAFLDKWIATKTQTSTGRPIDGLLTPPAPITACLPGKNRHVGYTRSVHASLCFLRRNSPLTLGALRHSFFNLLDLPAVVFPVTKVDPSVDKPDSNPQPLNDEDALFLSDCKLAAAVPRHVLPERS